EKVVSYLDSRFISTPAIAISAGYQEIAMLLDTAVDSLKVALDGFISKNDEGTEDVINALANLNTSSKTMTEYLVKVSAQNVSVTDEAKITAMYSNLSDIARVAELAENVTKYTKKEIDEDLVFSDNVKTELIAMFVEIRKLSELAKKVVLTKDISLIQEVEETENRIDDMRRTLIKDHMARLNSGLCRSENSSVFINLVCNMERAGDHIDYVAHSVCGENS
ncbi:MAG: Na/Pi cotransporter family protein, partial [Clostridia bacterium]|nr:Na/Pi cotransporter family protein [Clostridia bacterium]